MSRSAFALVIAAAVGLAPALRAQQPGRPGAPNGPPPGVMPRQQGGPADRPPMGPSGGPDAASMMLAHTGELELTDAQVTKLAAIARRTAERHHAMMGTVDSMRATNRPAPPQGNAPPAVRPSPSPAAVAQMEKMRAAAHADLRDAIAVLTPEQQARGWEMMAQRGRGGQGGPPRRPPGDAPER